jgi:OmpA family
MARLKKAMVIATGIALSFLITATMGLAQNLCSESVVYFDSGKADLTTGSRQKLDSLLRLWANREVLLELEGHTDSVNGIAYNQVLSEKRVLSVKQYLQNHGKAILTVRQFGRSESKPVANNGTDLGKALNRRVVLKYVSLEGGKVKVGGTKSSEVSFDVDAVGDCSVCGSLYKAKYYDGDRAIAAGGWGMTTTEGQTLTSGGMMSFATGCKDKTAQEKPFAACFEFFINADEPEFKGWITNEKGIWEEVPMTIEGNIAKICVPDFTWGRAVNCDCPVVPQYVFSDSSKLKVIHSSLVANVLRGEPEQYLPSVIYDTDEITRAIYKSIAVDSQNTIWVCNKPIHPMENTHLRKTRCTPLYPFVAKREHYRAVRFSDSIQQIKLPAKYKITSMEYFIKDADTTFAFQQVDRRRFEAKVLLYGHTLRLKSASGKLYTVMPITKRLKYNAKKRRMVGRIRKL